MPFFTIIIPTYNSASIVARAIESTLEQEFKDFEILIMDGQSNDETVHIANGYGDKRIRVFSEKDLGIYNAMNKGVTKSEGCWLYFLGSDDTIMSKSILQDVYEFISDEMDVVYGDVISTRFNGRYDGEFDYNKILQKNICHQAIFFNKKSFEGIGWFDESFRAHADWDHNMRWIFASKIKNRYIDRTIAIYADGGVSSRTGDDVFNLRRNLNYVKYGRKRLSRYIKWSILKLEMKKALRRRNVKFFVEIIVQLPSLLINA
jgi:glycosyltransferase involved in cell wall biosynthesis